MKCLFILFMLLSFSRTWAQNYPACKSVEDSIEYSCYEKNYDGLQQRLKNRLKSKQKIVFKELLRAKAIEKVEAQEKALNTILDCFEKKLDTNFCLYTKEQANYDYKIMRKYLGLFHNNTLIDHFDDRDIDKVNSQIQHFGFISDQKLTPLSQNEVDEAVSVFNSEKDENFLFNELESKPNRKSLISILKFQNGIKEVKESLKARAREYYIKLSLINPVITFLSSEKPTDDELYNAYNKLKEKFKRDKKNLEEKSYGDLNELFYFSSFINDVLAENPFYCDIAEELSRNYTLDADVKDSALSYGGSLLAFYSGPLGIAGLALGNSYNVYQKIQSVRSAASLSYIAGEAGAFEVDKKASEAGNSAMNLPLNIFLGGLASGSLMKKSLGFSGMVSLDLESSYLMSKNEKILGDKIKAQERYLEKNYKPEDSRVKQLNEIISECQKEFECRKNIDGLKYIITQKFIKGDVLFQKKLLECNNTNKKGKDCSSLLADDDEFMSEFGPAIFPSIYRLKKQGIDFFDSSKEKKINFILSEVLKNDIRKKLLYSQAPSKDPVVKTLVKKISKGKYDADDLGSKYSIEIFLQELDNALFDNILKEFKN